MPKSDQIPPCPSDIPAAAPDRAFVRAYDIELITPMFGGGVETRVNDTSFPIRPTAIRGQLQFWWRATVGARYETLQELRAAQSEVWGDTSRASRVDVRVEILSAAKPEPCAGFDKDRNRPDCYRSMPTWYKPFNGTALPYALFPFQGQLSKDRREIEVEPASCIHNARLKVSIVCDEKTDFTKQVEPALWAWVNFGGLGSRTRRGCGAIRCDSLMPKDRNELFARAKAYLSEDQPKAWPTLAGALLFGNEFDKPLEAWNEVIRQFRDFRQGTGRGRNEGQLPNRPGRSRYPEPETIRTVLYNPQAPWPHERMEHIPNDAFPRAELGLPIVFHFQGQGEPPDTVLYPATDAKGQRRDRMASPLILKPLALQSGKAIPLILLLKTPALTGVDLRRGDNSLILPPTTVIRDPRLAKYPNSPLAGSPKGSAIEAFLAFARSKGFTEVTR